MPPPRPNNTCVGTAQGPTTYRGHGSIITILKKHKVKHVYVPTLRASIRTRLWTHV